MRIATSYSTERDTTLAASSALASLVHELGGAPDWLFAQATASHPAEAVRQALAARGPITLHGGSSCLGVMTRAGMHGAIGPGLALFGVRDARGAYGVASAELGDNAEFAARTAVHAAMAHAGRPGEVPALVWMTTAPGVEEACIAGIEAVLGPSVPIVGGSSADDTIAGAWYQMTGRSTHRDALVVSLLYPSGRLASTFQSGYTPTACGGRVTRAHGRTIHEIDGAPAAAVYNTWTRGAIADALEGGNVLADSTLFPLGRQVGGGEVAYYRLAHPAAVGTDGSLQLFADFTVGDQIVLMHGSQEALVTRAGRVVSDALTLGRVSRDQVAGALVVFCAGCMLAVREDLDRVIEGIREALGAAPFLGCFTFGEQGCLPGGENRHGNLMISATLFIHS